MSHFIPQTPEPEPFHRRETIFLLRLSFCCLCPGRIQESPRLVEDIIRPPLNIFNVYCLHLVTLDKTFCKVDYLPTRFHRNYSLHGANFTVFIVSHFSCDWNSIPSRSSQGKMLLRRNLNIYISLNLSAAASWADVSPLFQCHRTATVGSHSLSQSIHYRITQNMSLDDKIEKIEKIYLWVHGQV